MNILNFFKKPRIADPDEMVIAQLKKAGSDLSKPHHVDFFLYFSSEVAANNVKGIILKQYPDDKIRVDRSPTDEKFCCQIERVMVPTLEAMQEARVYFDDLSSRFGGNYDGWGTPVVK